MPRFIPALLFAATLLLAPSSAIAAERAGDAALGALSGAVVSFGAAAGAVVGYTTGHIAHGLGWRSSPHYRRTRSVSAAAPAPEVKPTPLPKPRPDAVPSARSQAPTQSAGGVVMPPAQSLE